MPAVKNTVAEALALLGARHVDIGLSVEREPSTTDSL
jgi:hypothetical protein